MAMGDPEIPERIMTLMGRAISSIRIADPDVDVIIMVVPKGADDSYYAASSTDRERMRRVLQTKIDYIDRHKLLEAARPSYRDISIPSIEEANESLLRARRMGRVCTYPACRCPITLADRTRTGFAVVCPKGVGDDG